MNPGSRGYPVSSALVGSDEGQPCFQTISHPSLDRETLGPLSCPSLTLVGSKKRSAPRGSHRIPISTQLCTQPCCYSFLGLLQLCVLLLLYSVQKSHLNVWFSTDFSKSLLNFCLTCNHFWIAELLRSLIIPGAETDVCPGSPTQDASQGSYLGKPTRFRMCHDPLAFHFSLSKQQIITARVRPPLI